MYPEHTPTYTTGRRDNSPNPDTLHPEEKKVQNVGAEFHITKRGGQVTYHGPGQLVGYPIMDLNRMDVSLLLGQVHNVDTAVCGESDRG
jgi:lipoyl(octanoyl) transferase